MAEEFIIKFSSDLNAGLDAATGGGGGAGGKAKGGGAIGGLAKLGGLVAIGTAILSILADSLGGLIKPIKSMLTGIFKLIGELLRPIADIIIILLQPFLTLIRPLIQMFRTMMQPFIGIAREFGRMASNQMAQGNVAGAMGLSLEAAKTVIGPFIVSITSILLQLATSTLLGSVGSVVNLLIGAIGQLFSFIPGVGERAIESANNMQMEVSGAMTTASTAVNTFLQNTTDVVLGAMLDDAQTRLNNFKEMYPSDYNTVMFEIPAGALAEMKAVTGEDSAAMENAFTTAMDDMKDSTDTVFNSKSGTAVSAYKEGLNALDLATADFLKNMESSASRLRNINTTPSRSSGGVLDTIFGIIGINSGRNEVNL